MNGEHLVAAVLAVAVVAALVYWGSLYNHVQRLLNLIPEAQSNITVLRKKRTDLIAKLMSMVESFGVHESGIAGNVAGEFSGKANPTAQQAVVARLASLRMTFPDLKADALYNTLMQELSQVETDIAARREQYNSAVRAYNTVLRQFPNNLLLAPFRFPGFQFILDEELAS